MNELERLKQRVGLSTPTNSYANRKLGTYKPYEEDEEEKERKRLESQVEAIKTIAEEQKPIEIEEVDNRYKSHNYREYSLSRIEKDYNKTLVDDINNTIAYKKGLGMSDQEIQEGFKAKDSDPMSRLAEIEKKLKQGEERGLYRVQEGYLQKQAQGILAEEANKEANGLPSKRAEVNKWMQDHPELELDTTKDKGFVEKSLDSGIRFMGEMAQMGLEGTKQSVKEPLMWGTVAAIWAGSLMLAPVTGGASLFVPATATAAWLGSATALTALGFGMTAGRTKYMADLEAGLAYNEYVESGVNPEIAKPIAETVGALNGILESMQFETMVKAVPGVNDLAKRTTGLAKNELSKKLLKIGTAYGVDLGGNVLEEMMQESNTNLGATLSMYMQEAPNPNTADGLKLLTKTMTSEEHLARVAESGVQAAMSMWLMPIGSSVGGYTVNRTITQLEQSAAKKAANGWYTEEEKQTKAYQDEAKKVLPYAVEVLAKDAKENKSEDSVKGLAAVVTILEDIEKRPDLSNEDKAKISETKQKANEALAKVEYDVKSENPDIELAVTNKQEIEQKILNKELPKINPNLTEVTLEFRQKAQDKGIYTIIYNGLLEGKRKSEISAEVEKLLPRKERNAVEIMEYINGVEALEVEIKIQINAASIANLMSVKDSLKTKAPEQPTTSKTEVSQPTDSLDTENLATDIVEPVEGNEAITPIPKEPLEVVEGKFEPSDIVRVPLSKVKIDQKKYQFRFDGTTDKLEGMEWDDNLAGVVSLHENEYGDLYAIDGHHRIREGQLRGVKDIRAKIYKGISVEEARAMGALLNIAQGNASAIDTAKFLRDTNSTLEDLTKLGVPPKSKIARDGANLAKLEEGLFYMAATKQIPYERAVMIGRELEDKVAQRQFYDMMVKEETKRGYLKDSTIDAMLSQVKAVGAVEYFQGSLLGADDTKSAVVERAELVAYVKDNLKNKKNVLKKINKSKNARMLEQLGNKIKVDDNVKEMELADQALYLLDKTVNAKDSKVGKMFNELAIEYAKTGDKKILDQALKMVGELMESGELLEEALGRDKLTTDILDALEEIDGQADMFSQLAQLKEMPSIKVIAKRGTNEDTHAKLMPLIEIMEKNPIFNGLEIVFTGQESTRFMDRSELDAKGYRNYKPGYYTEYGSFRSLSGTNINTRTEGDNAQRTNQGDSTGDQLRNNQYTPKTGYTRGNISLTNSAQVDTLLHEAIHSIQDILERIDPEFSVLVKAWENEIFELAKEQGIELPQGKEMLAHALMLGEFGYANDSFELAKAVEVPTEIIDRFKAMLGKEFVKGAMGESKADSNRKLKADYKKIADINLQSTEIAQSISQARNRRLNKIKMDLRAGQPIRYYSPDTTTYAIAIPKDTDYEVSFFNEQGLLTKAVLDINKLAKKLSDMRLYYNAGEISYQLKQFNRDQIDNVVMGSAIDNPSEIVRAFENARIGNFTATDYDNYLKGKLNDVDNKDLLKAIKQAAEKGLDKPNNKVTIHEYVNRFYPQPDLRRNEYLLREIDGKIEYYERQFSKANPYDPNGTIPERVLRTFNSAAKAIEGIRAIDNLDLDMEDYKELLFKQHFSYMPDYWDKLVKEYEDFRGNYETFRSDYSTEFDGRVKANVSYQIKNPLIDSRRIDPTKGEALSVAFKGFKDGETRRISTGDQWWDSLFFVADNYKDANLYGEKVEIYDVSPDSKILYEGTKEFSSVSKPSAQNETMLEWASRIAAKAKEQGYDAVWFKRQGEIGTAVINRGILSIPDDLKNYQIKASTDTENFKKWFKDSKVVDEEGNPLVVYHGSPNVFDIFNDTEIGNKTGNLGWYGKGFYFTSSKYLAKQYGDNVYEAYLSIQKPFIIDGNTNIELVAQLAETDIYDASQNIFINMENMIAGNEEVFTDNLRKQGYDGVIVNDMQDFQEVVVFNPTQIKSIYNNGNFSLYDPNINYQLKSVEGGIEQYSLGNINNFVEAEENKTVIYSDTVDLFNNKVLSVKGDITDRLMPFIKYDAVMGGYDSIKINGEDPVAITNEEILEVMEKGQPLFQIKELVAVHNLSEGQLKSTVKLGGIVMPSIAVTLKSYLHDRYGEISLLFNKSTIDPRANKDNRVYSGDAYTPEFPSIRYKISDKEAQTLRDRVKSALAGTQYMNEYRDTIDATNIEDRVNREGSFEGAYKYDPLLMLTYLKEKGIEFEPVMRTKNYEFDVPLMEQLQAIEGELINKQYLESAEIEQLDSKFREAINKFYGVNLYKEAIGYGKMDRIHSNIREFSKDTTRETIDGRATESKLQETIDHADYTKWFNKVSKDIIEAEGIRNNRDIFTNSGTRRGWNALHDPVTLDNILKAMKSESETASGMFGGVGRFGAAVSRKFTSIADIKAAVDRLSTMDEETYNAMREGFQERLIELASRIKDTRESNRFIAVDHAFDAMVDAFSNGKGRAGVAKILNEYPGLNITEDAIDEMMQLADEVAQMPTEYFEAKPRRIVGLEEIQAVIMPLDSDPELVQMLKNNGIHLIEFYDKAIEGDRQRAMDEVLGKNDVSFQIKPTPTDTEAFKKYFGKSAAVDENGKPLRVYHGTTRAGFDDFYPEAEHKGRVGIFFTRDKNIASTYAGTERMVEKGRIETIEEAYELVSSYNLYLEPSYHKKGQWYNEDEFTVAYPDWKEWDEDDLNIEYELSGVEGNFINSFSGTDDLLDNLSNEILDYAYKQWEPGIYEVYLSMQNPLVIEGRGSNWDSISAYGIETDEDGDPIRSVKDTNGWAEYALLSGYDGVIFKDVIDSGGRVDYYKPSDIYVVFEPEQVKSVYNRGTWSATDINMYYQIKNEPDMEERSWGQTVRDSGVTEQWLTDLLTDNKFMYEVAHNEDSILAGAKLIQDKGEEYIIQKIKGKFEADAKLFAASQILTYKYMEGGERDLAMDILAATAAKATTAGQAIQILSVWNKQTPEGMLRSVRKDFDGLSTEAQKKELERLYEEIKKEAKRINKVAVTKLKLQRALEKLEAMSQQEMDTLEIAQNELKTAKTMLKQKVKTQKKTVLTGDIKNLIMQTITDHYNGEGGSLYGKLKGLGLNDLEVKQLVDFTNAEMKALTQGENLNAIQRLIKGKGDAVDKQISDLMAEGKYGDAMKAAIGQKKGIPVLTQDMVDFIYERGKEINSLPEGSRERTVASARLIRDIMEQMPVAKSRKIATFQTMAQLLNIKTTLRNLIGNSAFRRLDTLTLNTIGAAVDVIMASKSGQRVQLARLADAKKKQKEGYRIGWAEGKQDAIEGINTTESATKFELKASRTFKRNTALGQTETVLNLALRATDRAAFTASYLDSLEEQMLIEGVAEPTDLMHDRATAIALYRTFNDSTKLSKGFSKLKAGANDLLGNEEFGLGDFILKYPKTPANILGRAIDYSPAGLVVTAFKLFTDTSGDAYIKQRIKVDGVSRAIMGSGVMAMGAILARLGILTGSNPDDEDEEVYKMRKQAGLRDFSVNTSALWRVITSGFTDEKAGELREGDILASYDWFEPMAMGLAVGADTVLGKGESFNALSTVIRAWEVGATSLADQPLLSGIANLFRYGDVVGGLTNIALQAPASFVPSLLSHTAQAMDGRNTDPYTNYSEAEKAWNLIKNKLPIARGTIPSRVDALGSEQRYFPEDELIPVTVFKSMVSPAIINQYAPSEDMQMLIDLYQETDDIGVIPRTRTSFTKDKVKYNPKPEELESMRKWLGESTRLEISRALNGYAKGWDSQSQADEVGSIINKMWEEAKTKYVRGDFN